MKNSYYQGKTAVITGASEGIGLALAEDLAALGTNLTLCARGADKLRRAGSRVEAKSISSAQKVKWISVDVTDPVATKNAMVSIAEEAVPDFLFNCAGIAHPGYLQDLEVEVLRQMMDVNYFGAVHTTKALLPYFVGARRGHVVNVSSMGGFLGLFGYTGYCASKYAVVGFSQALRQELKPFGVRVAVLCPPNTRTPGLLRENLSKPSEVLKLEEKAKVIEASDVSRALLKALPRNKFMILPTFDGALAYYLSRYAPGIIDRFLKRPLTAS